MCGLGVFALALLLRLVGIGWGLPGADRFWSLHPDEPVVWGVSQRINPARLDFDPGFYNYGTLYLTLVNVGTSVVDAYGGGPAGQTVEAHAEAMGRYHLAGRVISAVAGAGLAWVVLAILLRLTNLFGAVFGGLAIAVAPALVVHSRFQTVDMVATLFVGLSLLYATNLALAEPGTRRFRDAMLAGFFAGLSAGTKYSGVLALIALGVALWLAWRRDRSIPGLRSFGLGAAACVAAFLVTTPGAIKNTERFVQDVRFELAHTAEGHGFVFAGTPTGFVFHVQNLWDGLGFLLVLLGAAGLAAALWRGKPWAWALGAFALATYVLIGRAEVKFMRYTFPLMPVLAIGAGWLVGQAHQNPNRRWRLAGVAGVFGLGGLGGGGLADSGLTTWWMTGPDPRDEAGSWLRREAAGKSVGLVKDPWFWTATLYPGTAAPRSVPFAQRDAEMRAVRDPKVLRHVSGDPDARTDWDVRLLTEDAPDFVTFSSFEFDDLDRLSRMREPPEGTREAVNRFVAFGRELNARYQPVFAAGADGRGMRLVHDMMYVRPTIWVWKRRPDTPKPSAPSSTTSTSSEAPPATP
jgi:hypothetical protein